MVDNARIELEAMHAECISMHEEIAARMRGLLNQHAAPTAPNDGPCNCDQALGLQRLLDRANELLVLMAKDYDALNAAIDRLHRHHIDAIKSMRYALARLLNEQQLNENKP